MKIYIVKKEKTKRYDSAALLQQLFDYRLEHGPKGEPIGLSISDTKNYWSCAFGDCGLDIEEKGRKIKPSLIRALHPREQEYFSALSPGSSEFSNEFLRLWTAKEAYMKLKKQGLSMALDSFSLIGDDLDYVKEIDGYKVQSFEYRDIIGCLISSEGLEIEEKSYAGKNAKSCMDHAADLLSVKMYSVEGLKSKLLQKGYDRAETEETLERLKELSYLDDAAYAAALAESAREKGKGPLYVRQKLIQNGVDPSLAPEDDDQAERAMQLASSMKGKSKEQIGRRLAALGYEASVIFKVLSKLR